jgi:hypothetical protein
MFETEARFVDSLQTSHSQITAQTSQAALESNVDT